MARFADDDIDAIKQQVDLVALIGESIPLRQSGSNHVGLCPFHDERTPSFSVNRAGFFHCFGCGESGDAFTWLEKHEHLAFPDAVEYLAGRAGVTLTRIEDPAETSQRAIRREMERACTIAQDIFTNALDSPAADLARRELTGRRFGPDDAHAHGCGYAPPATVEAALRKAGISQDVMEQTGLGGRRGRLLTGRLTWPIHDAAGHLVGFAGRRLHDGDGGKYVNSPGSPVFRKSHLLYRLHVAKKIATQQGRIHVVEGYTDVMAVEKAGLAAVASCGTAFTAEHIDVLTRTLPDTTAVVFCLDGDTAGVEATVKAWRAAQNILDRCEAVLLTESDPCDLHAAGEDVAEALSTTVPLTQAVLGIVIDAHLDGTPEGKSRALRAATDLMKDASNQVVVDGYRTFVADRVGVDPSHLDITAHSRPAPQRPSRRPDAAPNSGLEQAFWEACITSAAGEVAATAQPEWFRTVAAKELAELAQKTSPGEGWVRRLGTSASPMVKDVIARSANSSGPDDDPAPMLRRIERAYWLEQAHAAREQMALPGADVTEWMERWSAANARAKQLRD